MGGDALGGVGGFVIGVLFLELDCVGVKGCGNESTCLIVLFDLLEGLVICFLEVSE